MRSPAEFYVTQIKSCDQSLVTLFRFNNLGLALAMALKFYTSMAKELKLKVLGKKLQEKNW